MDDEGTKVFHNDDRAYEQWVAQHGGFVLTAPRKGEYMLHEAACTHLGTRDPRRRLTRKPRRWGERQETLVAWTEQAIGAKLILCQSCI